MRVAVDVAVSVVEDGRLIVRGKKGIVEVPVGIRFSLGSLVMRIGADGLLEGEGEVELGCGASRCWGLL